MKFFLIALLRLYQIVLSPVLALLGARCRFEQNCSQYAIHMIRTEPLWRALRLVVVRLSQCRPSRS